MNLQQLAAALTAAGLPPDSFQIAEVHETRPTPTDFWFLRPGPDHGWEVGAYERGQFDVRACFDTESNAAQWMLTTLTGTPSN
ncbi:hypothetical protein [Nocardia sp. NPDC058480]|uniref:hypothetical protein n=1 Tax=unclassified Nocardia TaxID=2637762 RepID=UPI0036651031